MSNKKAIIIGISVLALAACVVLLCVLAKNADGTVTRAYFTDGQFYCTKGDAAMVFTPDNAEAYAAFYATLKAMLQ